MNTHPDKSVMAVLGQKNNKYWCANSGGNFFEVSSWKEMIDDDEERNWWAEGRELTVSFFIAKSFHCVCVDYFVVRAAFCCCQMVDPVLLVLER